MTTAEFKTIAHLTTIPLGREELRIDLVEVNGGSRYYNIRRFYPDATGSWQPSRKGVTFPEAALAEIAKTLTAEATRRRTAR